MNATDVETQAIDRDEPREDDLLLGDAHGKHSAENASGKDNNRSLTRLMLCTLLLGEFVAHVDTTLIFVAAPGIASDLGDLQNAGWLPVAYTLAVCAMQPLFGKFCDIFGAKQMLVFAYTTTSLGCLACGLSATFPQIIAGRIVSGIGGAGVMTVASIVVVGSVEKSQIATYRSVINLASTLGRSVGAPVGGLITDRLSWHWLFHLRLPIFGLSLLLIGTAFRNDKQSLASKTSIWEKIPQVDWSGALLLQGTLVPVVVLMSNLHSIASVYVMSLIAAMAILCGSLFTYRALYVSPNPIFDLRILREPNVALSYAIGHLQTFSQVSLMYTVPLYFQVSKRSSSATAGARMLPAVVANTFGSLLAGYIIRRSRRFKSVLVCTGLLGISTFVLLLLLWNGRSDATGTLEALYTVPAGCATGLAQAAAFLSMTSCLDPAKVSMATGVYFLTSSLGTVSGVASTNSLISKLFRKELQETVTGPGSSDVIGDVLGDFRQIDFLHGRKHEMVVHAFLKTLNVIYFIGIGTNVAASSLATLLRQVEL